MVCGWLVVSKQPKAQPALIINYILLHLEPPDHHPQRELSPPRGVGTAANPPCDLPQQHREAAGHRSPAQNNGGLVALPRNPNPTLTPNRLASSAGCLSAPRFPAALTLSSDSPLAGELDRLRAQWRGTHGDV